MFGRRVLQRGRAATRRKVRNAQEAHEAIRPTDFRLAPQQLGRRARRRRAAALRADLEAHDGVADGGRARAEDDAWSSRRSGPGGDPACSPRAGKAIEFAGFRRAYVEGSDDPAAELEEQETMLPAVRESAIAVHGAEGGAGPRCVCSATRAEAPRDAAAGALHRGLAHQEARGGGHRPAVHLRVDHRDDPAPRLRVPPGQGARPELHGVRGDRAAARALRRLRRRRVHRGDGGGPRRDLQRRARAGSSSSASFYRGDGKHDGLEARRVGRVDETRLPGRRVGDGSRDTAQPIRVRIGRFGPFLQRGEGGPATPRRCPTTLPPADSRSSGRSNCSRRRPTGPRALGDRPGDGPARLRDDRPVRRRTCSSARRRRRPTKKAREAEARVAAARHERIDRDARRGAASCWRCRASSACTPTTASRSSPTSAASART